MQHEALRADTNASSCGGRVPVVRGVARPTRAVRSARSRLLRCLCAPTTSVAPLLDRTIGTTPPAAQDRSQTGCLRSARAAAADGIRALPFEADATDHADPHRPDPLPVGTVRLRATSSGLFDLSPRADPRFGASLGHRRRGSPRDRQAGASLGLRDTAVSRVRSRLPACAVWCAVPFGNQLEPAPGPQGLWPQKSLRIRALLLYSSRGWI